MTTPILFIDTNIVMYAVGAEHPLKAPSVSLLDAIARGRIRAVTSVEVHQEILHRYSALGQRDRAVEVCVSFLEIVPDVLPVTRDDINTALTLHREHPALPTRDIVHLATMHRHGIHHIVSADRHFDLVSDLSRIDPTGISVLVRD
jgi:uncharacterized protein